MNEPTDIKKAETKALPSSKGSAFACDDLRHPGYGERHRSGKKCAVCGKPAGTAWGPFFCPPCDIERKAGIEKSLEELCEPNIKFTNAEGNGDQHEND